MLPRTVYLSRLFGISLLIFAAGEFSQGSAMVNIAATFADAPGLMLITGIFTAVAGLAVVLGHNVWRGGAMPVIVTILGWLLLIKGTALLVVPASGWASAIQASHYAEFYALWVAIPLFLGAYLTFAGFSTQRPRRDSKS